MSRALSVEIPQPVPVSDPKPDGQVMPIALEPGTEIFTLPFHLCHRFLHDSQLSAVSQTHFAEEALTAMGLSSYSNISLSNITPDVLSDAGFARSSENEQLWLKDQLERSKYWVFNTGYPTMAGLLRWFMQIYQSEPNYELAQPSMILEAARRAINARQQAGLFSTAASLHTPSYLSGPATRSLSTYHSMASHLERRPSSAMPHHSSIQDHRPLDRSAERYHPARQEHHQVSAEVTLPADFIQAHRGSTEPITTAPIRIPVTIDLEINRPDPRDTQVRFYPQIEQRQELPFWVTPQMPHTPLPMHIAPQVSDTTMQVRPAIQQGLLPVTPSIAHTSMAVSPTISAGFMQVTPDIMQARMAVQPAISTGLMPVTPDITDGRMLVSSTFTPTTLPLSAEFAPATFSVTPTFTQANLQIEPALRPAQLAITSTIEPTDLPIRPTWTPATPVRAQLAIEPPPTQAQTPRPQSPEIPPRATPASTPAIRWPSAVPTGDLNIPPRRPASQQWSPMPTPRLALPEGIPSGSLTQPRPAHSTPPGAIPTLPLPLAAYPLGPTPVYPIAPTFPAAAFLPQPSYIPPQPLGPLQPPPPTGVTPPTAPQAQPATLRFAPPRQRQQTSPQYQLFDSDTEE
ncbi:MAG: hypothetical protein ACRC24_04780 [Vibrionaceae bacterium]